jgi:hypothetical protein
MKTTRLKFVRFIFLAALLMGVRAPLAAADGGHANVRAILVLASNQKGASDERLAAYEPTLRRILRFESYKLAGEGAATLAGAGKTIVKLGRGHALELQSENSDGKRGRLLVHWQDGGRSLMNTGLVLRPGVPAVLGGPANGKGGEVWAVILVAD